MLNRIVLFFTLFIGFSCFSQELNATVTVNSDKIQQTNKQIFNTLQNAIRDFLNNNRFTNLNTKRNELIDCNLLLIINTYDPNQNSFSGTLQVQSSRPVFQSSYGTTVLNFNDRNINFQYIEFEPLTYSENAISSNLVGILSFYANMIIGLDSDTFGLMEGTANYQKASNVVAMMQQGSDKGWVMGEANNRFALVNDVLSNSFEPYRQALYEYHIKGLDLMSQSPDKAKAGIASAISTLSNIHRVRSNALPTRIFFDAKATEIQNIFSGGPAYDPSQLIETLTKINPTNAGKWNRM